MSEHEVRMSEGEIRPRESVEHPTGEDTILYLSNVNVSFDGFKAINELTLIVKANELRSIIGPNGAGKTTMMDIVTGKTRPDSGDVVFGRHTDLTKLDEAAIANLGIGRKFQKPTVFENHTVFENLELALQGNRGVLQSLFFKLDAKAKGRIEFIMERIALSDARHRQAGELSHGQKQWLEIGMLLMQNPVLLLLDEPVAGMTHQEIDRTAELFRALAEERAVIVVEHDMEFVREISEGNKVTVLHQGSVLAEGSMDKVQNDPRVVEVYLGEAQ